MIHEKYQDVNLVKKPQSLIMVGTITLTLLMTPVFLKALVAMPKDSQNIGSRHQREGRVADSEIQRANLAKQSAAEMATSLAPSGLITYR
jgi:hypothetical protein